MGLTAIRAEDKLDTRRIEMPGEVEGYAFFDERGVMLTEQAFAVIHLEAPLDKGLRSELNRWSKTARKMLNENARYGSVGTQALGEWMIAEGFAPDDVDAALISGETIGHAPWHDVPA